jgi:predicted acyl esterase
MADYGLKEALSDDMDGVPKALAREVIGFASAPLDRAIEILGAPVVKLYVMPNRPQIQVVANLFDVSQGGERTLITRGQFGTRTAEPGQHVMVDIVLRTIGYLVERGHHLLLEVSNYDTMYAFPYFEPFVARVYHDHARASKVEIPLKPIPQPLS